MAKQTQTEFAYQRKTTLENSLMSLLNTERYQDITVKDICTHAGIPRRTFYHYFESKEDILDSVIDDMMTQCYLEVLFDIHSGLECMKESFSRIFRFWQGENRIKLDTLRKNGLESRMMTHALNWIQAEKIGFLQRDTLNPKLIEIGIMVGTTDFFSLLFYWSKNDYRETPEQMAEYAVWVLPQAFYNV